MRFTSIWISSTACPLRPSSQVSQRTFHATGKQQQPVSICITKSCTLPAESRTWHLNDSIASNPLQCSNAAMQHKLTGFNTADLRKEGYFQTRGRSEQYVAHSNPWRPLSLCQAQLNHLHRVQPAISACDWYRQAGNKTEKDHVSGCSWPLRGKRR